MKKTFLVTLLLVLISHTTRPVYAEVVDMIPGIGFSQCQDPIGMEHATAYTKVVGHDGQEPWRLYANRAPDINELSDLITLNILRHNSPETRWIYEQHGGIRHMLDYFLEDVYKPPPIWRMLPVNDGSSLAAIEPYFEAENPRPLWESGDSREDWAVYNVDLSDDYTVGNIDKQPGKLSTTESPLYIACIQEDGEDEGIAFAIYGKEEKPQMAETPSIHVTNIDALYMGRRIASPRADTELENTPGYRFVKDIDEKNRQKKETITKFTPRKVDCFDCESWAGDKCEDDGVFIPQTEECAQGKCELEEEEIATIFECPIWPLLELYQCLTAKKHYSLFVYGLNDQPYHAYRPDDMNLYSAIAENELNKDKYFADVSQLTRAQGEIKSTTFGIEGSRTRDVIGRYPKGVTYASGFCKMMEALSPPAPAYMGISFDYIGFKNPDQATEEELESPYGAIKYYCDKVYNGIKDEPFKKPPTEEPQPQPIPSPSPDFIVEKTVNPTKLENEELPTDLNWNIKVTAKYKSSGIKIVNETWHIKSDQQTKKQIYQGIDPVTGNVINIDGWEDLSLEANETWEVNYIIKATKSDTPEPELNNFDDFRDSKVTDKVTVDAKYVDRGIGGLCGIDQSILDRSDDGGKWNSTLLLQVISEAAAAYNVPASIMAGLLVYEGFHSDGSPRVHTYDDALVEQSIDPNGPGEPNCEPPNSVNAEGPWQLVNNDPINGWLAYRHAARDSDARPAGYEPNICNILDGAYAAAAKLRDSLDKFDSIGTHCEEWDEPPSLSCNWSKNNIKQAGCHYYGVCGNYVCGGGECYCDKMLDYYCNYSNSTNKDEVCN